MSRHSCGLRSLLLFLLGAACAHSLAGQEPPTPTLALRKQSEVIVSNEPAGPLLVRIPVRCDAAGNLYVRGYRPEAHGEAPVVRISTEGKKEAVFSLASAAGFEKSNAGDFSVGLRGEVYLLTGGKDSLANVLIFDKEGRYKSVVKLDGSFVPHQLAVSASGDFLVSGNRLDKELRRPTYEPFTGIFDRSGRLIKEIMLPGDVEPEEVKPKGEGRMPTRLENPGLELGIAETGEDGNFYLMRATPSPLFYVISPAGELLRRIVVPSPGPKYRPIAMKPVAGKLLVVFERQERQASPGAEPERIYSTADNQTGEQLIDYTATPEQDGIFACYSPKGFTFLATTDSLEMLIRQAAP